VQVLDVTLDVSQSVTKGSRFAQSLDTHAEHVRTKKKFHNFFQLHCGEK